MITNFKIFENNEYNEYNVYWKVRIDKPYFDVSCWKLGVPESRFKFVNNKHLLKEMEVGEYIYIQKIYSQFGERWEWDKLKKHVSSNLKYKGEVKITNKDVELYYLSKDAKKYNI